MQYSEPQHGHHVSEKGCNYLLKEAVLEKSVHLEKTLLPCSRCCKMLYGASRRRCDTQSDYCNPRAHVHRALIKLLTDVSKFCSCLLLFRSCELITFFLPCLQVANGFEDCAEVLLQSRADPTLKDHQGRTAVHFAALCGHFSLVETLIQHGGSPSTPDKHGYSPIHWAAYNGHDKCLEALLEVSGCNVC